DYTLVFRKNTLRTEQILAPSGAIVTWQIQESESVVTNPESPTVAASGSGRLLSFTPTRITDAITGRVLSYDIVLTAIVGMNIIERRIRRGIIIAPTEKTVADAT